MAVVLIAGGSGLVGTRLSEMLKEKGYETIILTREVGAGQAVWNLEEGTIDLAAISKADFIIHLAGASVAEKRWTKKRKIEIAKSRTDSSALLIQALKTTKHQVKAFISASAIGWYGPDTTISREQGFSETDPSSNDFLGETCNAWEASVMPVMNLGIRLVVLRTGIVFSDAGGFLASFKKPIHTGIAPILGNGKQVISWIHVDDLCRMYIHAMEHENIQGVFNAVAPSPVSNEKLVLALAKKLKGSFFIPVHIPSFLLKILFGEMSIEVLKSTSVSCSKIKQQHFQFIYPSMEATLEDLIK
ncbi:MAG: TIGR01777 family oxidoreductase [Bacteroidetes bacterium]|nr:TIGR01777 family oxidoreductase [Bacteroidota bacterium]